MNRRRLLYLVGGIPVAAILFLLLTLAFTSNQAIKGVLVRRAADAGYTLDITGFAKALPFGFKASALQVATGKGALVKLDHPRVTLELLPLLAGKVRVAYRGNMGGGKVAGEVSLGKKQGWNIEGRGIHLEEVPFFTSVAGARVKGELRITGEAENKPTGWSGNLQMQVKSADLAGVKLGEMPLPDASYRDVRGALGIERGVATLKSFTLDGDGIYVRLKGDSTVQSPVGNSPLNLTLELMPRPEFLERQKFVFLLLVKYQTSPGAYSIPVHGTLAHPAV